MAIYIENTCMETNRDDYFGFIADLAFLWLVLLYWVDLKWQPYLKDCVVLRKKIDPFL